MNNICTDFQTFILEQNKIKNSQKYNIGDILTSKEMVNYIIDNKLRDSYGIIKDINDVKYIAYYSETWKLENVELNNFDFYADKDFKNKSQKAYPIVFYCDGKYEVLDGKHRIGMQKEAGNKNMLMFVGYC